METEALHIEQEHPTRTVDEDALRRVLRGCIEGEGARLEALTVVLADHETVLTLNREYLAHDYLTDVLSFSFADEGTQGVVDGEVYVDLDTAAERCAEFEASFTQEAVRYCIHGLLHLLGYDDATAEQKAAMHAREDLYLNLL